MLSIKYFLHCYRFSFIRMTIPLMNFLSTTTIRRADSRLAAAVLILHTLWTSLILSLLAVCRAIPPPPPINCTSTTYNCTVSNAYGVWGDRIPCHASRVVYPSTEQEIVNAVADAVKNNLKLKVVTAYSHSISKLACPDQRHRDGNGGAIVISTRDYNREIEVVRSAGGVMTVTADSGVGLRDLVDAAAQNGGALAVSPYWEGVSLGGLLSTGSHGSSLWGKGGSVHDYVVGMRLVVPASPSDGYAKIVTFNQSNPDLNAAKVSLGVLGVISKVTLSVEPQFKRNITYAVDDDADLEQSVLPFAAAHEFGDVTWYPSQRRIVYRMDDRVPVGTPGNGLNDFIGFQPTSVLVAASIRATETMLEKTRNGKGKCREARALLASKLALGNGLKNDGSVFTKYPVVGLQSRMQTSGSCRRSASAASACPWDPRIKGLFFYETSAIFSVSAFKDFISDVKRLRAEVEAERMCGVDLYNGFLIRFVKASTAYLGQAEDSVAVDFNYYRADEASTPRLNEDVWEEVEQMAFFKHGARPHWGKNRNLAFQRVAAKYPNLPKFLRAMKSYDPQGLFSSEWSDHILLGSPVGLMDSDGCALEGLCVCSEDRHCAPSKGYFCRPGRIYSDARVCRYKGD